jgi:DNA-binding LytR/AlgR family response regulator
MILLIIAEKTESRLVKKQLKNVSEITKIVESYSAEDALFTILELEPSIIIISNDLPGRSGFELAYLLQKIKFNSFLIILSNNPDNAIDAIKSKVFDYLIYPFPGERLVKAVQNAVISIEEMKQLKLTQSSEDPTKVRLTVLNGFILADLNQLSYCKADGAYTRLFFNNGRSEYSSHSLGKIEEILSKHQFLRINRSVMVNMRMLKEINEKGKFCMIDTGKEIIRLEISNLGIRKLEEKQLF